MAEGTYTLLVAFDAAATVRFGALGERDLSAGRYAYVGSAFGPGGFARVDRHRRTARGEHDTRYWHVDYLLAHPAAGIDAVVRSAGADVECAVAAALAGDFEGVDGVGCSDCGCDSHLFYAADAAALDRAVRDAHERLGGE